MAGNYCPIYDRQDGRLLSIGLWALDGQALDRAIAQYRASKAVDAGLQADLLSLAGPMLRFLTEAKTRRIPNKVVHVGNGVQFQGGLFIMLDPYRAPNEELLGGSARVSYVLQAQDGITMLKRSGPRPDREAGPMSSTLPKQSTDADDEVDRELFEVFEEEAAELLPQLRWHFKDWLADPTDRNAAAACMRVLRTFKGAAMLSGAVRVSELAHRLEFDIERMSSEGSVVTGDIEQLVHRTEEMALVLEALGARQSSDFMPQDHTRPATTPQRGDPQAASRQAKQTGREERYCTHHKKTIAIALQTPETGDAYRVCTASLPVAENTNACANAFCIHSVLALALAKPVLVSKGLSVENATQSELQKVLLSMGLQDCAPDAASGTATSKWAPTKPSDSGCFVATACYGDAGALEVQTLRRYRDEHLAAHRFGRMLIRTYYAISPGLANWLSTRPRVRALIRHSLLEPLVAALRRNTSPKG